MFFPLNFILAPNFVPIAFAELLRLEDERLDSPRGGTRPVPISPEWVYWCLQQGRTYSQIAEEFNKHPARGDWKISGRTIRRLIKKTRLRQRITNDQLRAYVSKLIKNGIYIYIFFFSRKRECVSVVFVCFIALPLHRIDGTY